MNISVLVENTSLSPAFLCEHGLSLLIETEKQKILFDMGQTDAYLKNAKALGISLQDVDFAVLSHGHYDHGGGIPAFFQENDHAPLYLSQTAFGDFYNAEEKYIGLDKQFVASKRIHLTGNVHTIHTDCTLFSCNDFDRPFPAAPHGLKEKCGKHIYADRFHHEQYLLIREGGKRILFSGCSHKGILNIINWFRPHVLIGGLHLMKTEVHAKDGLACLNQVADMMKKEQVICYTGHCTGQEQFDYLKEKLGDQLHALSAGYTFTI